MPMLKRFRSDQAGATSIEYSLIAGLVFLVALAGITALGKSTNTMYNVVSTNIVGASS